MYIARFALGMRIPKEKLTTPQECMKLFLKNFSQTDISGLILSGGMVDDMYIIVIMGGSLGMMRNVYRRILSNKEFCTLLADELPIIENNRLAKMPELEPYGTLDENGAFIGGNCCFGLTVN
ncbi:MAG: hypothetical protein IJC24_05730 [Clostridia bacterium]|nr:hypothetical protein [Clostridia bacterium]